MSNFSMQVSSIYIGLLAIWLLLLAVYVVKMRIKHKVAIGDGGKEPMLLAIRTHANAVEYIPLGLILLIGLENTWQMPWLVHLMGLMLLIGRVLHAVGLSQQSGENKPRAVGILFTWTMVAVSAVAVLVYGLMNL